MMPDLTDLFQSILTDLADAYDGHQILGSKNLG